MTHVWRTRRGGKFHARPDCEALRDGQTKAASEGRFTHPPESHPLSALSRDIEPCLVCWQQEDGWMEGWLRNRLKAEHHSGQADGSPWEDIFVREILEKLEVNPHYVTVQDVVQRNYGAPLRPDFTICVPGCTPLAIEIDGNKSKWFPEASSPEGTVKRDEELESMGWRVLHFTNTQVTQEPEFCRSRVVRVLKELQSAAAPLLEKQLEQAPSEPLTAIPGREPAAPEISVPGPSVGKVVSQPVGAEKKRSGQLLIAAVVTATILFIGFIAGTYFMSPNRDEPEIIPGVSGECPEKAPVKGNIAQNGSKIFHEPGWEFYGRTDPEQCFANAADAESAGFRASQRQ